MKKRLFFCLCICLCVLFSALLSACAAPELPEGSSAPAEESSKAVSVPEDPNAKVVRAYLEALLTEDPFTEERYLYWLTPERAETVRASVKQLKTPFLTEEDVWRIAERAATVYFSAWLGSQTIILPACGALEIVQSATGTFSDYSEHEEANNALLAYTLYLFTPPEYLFWSSEIWNEGWYPSNDAGVDPAHALCLPFAPAADYTSRQGALKAIREQQSCIRLYPLHITDEGRPLDFTHCGAPDLLRGGICTSLDLFGLVGRGDVPVPEEFRPLYEEADMQDWIDRIICYAVYSGVHGTYELRNGDVVSVYQLLSAENAQGIREEVEQLAAPILTRRYVKDMMHFILESDEIARSPLLLLPGVDGAEDVYLPSDLESLEGVLQQNEKDVAAKAYGAAAYLVDLLTPSRYRYTDLLGIEGTYYRLQNDPYYLLVNKKNELYIVDSMLNMVPLNLAA